MLVRAAPGGRWHAELRDEPAGERTRHGVTEHVGDTPQRVSRVLQVAQDQVAAHVVDHVVERAIVLFQTSLQGAHVHALGLGYLLDGGVPHR
ncbi:hypothetical protein D3C72_1923580 [compost metagenome]